MATIRFDRLGLCSGLPSPYVQAPALLEPPPAAASPLTCADLALREAQSPVVNQQVAVLAAHYAYRFLVCRELTQMATTFSLEPAVSKSYLLTKQRMAACGAGR